MVNDLHISAYEQRTSPELNDRLDELEALMLAEKQCERKINHHFTPGLYMRQIMMETNTLWMSKIHATEHPYAITQGCAYVKVNDQPWELLRAPYYGITKPGTRRVLIIPERCVWTTFHALSIVNGSENNLSKEEKERFAESIMDLITEKHENKYLCPQQ